MSTLVLILLVVAAVLFAVAAAGLSARRMNLVAAGLLAVTVALIVERL